MSVIPQIQMIPTNGINILNPRARNKRVFQELVTSIANLGLKKPITVSPAPQGVRFDLVCGQGRLEAFIALGETKIPAVVIHASREDCYVMSLVENLARRQHRPMELIQEIGTLRERGHTLAEIAVKVDFSPEYVQAICALLEHGEERLLIAVERGIIPHSIAIEIARSNNGEVQRALADAYEQKILPGDQILAIRRIIEQRELTGKRVNSIGRLQTGKRDLSAATLVRIYRRETDRQKLLVKKAALAQGRLLFVVNAFKRLLDDDHFRTLLRAEAITSLPGPLAERLGIEEI